MFVIKNVSCYNGLNFILQSLYSIKVKVEVRTSIVKVRRRVSFNEGL
jgi:hypothetical protein